MAMKTFSLGIFRKELKRKKCAFCMDRGRDRVQVLPRLTGQEYLKGESCS